MLCMLGTTDGRRNGRRLTPQEKSHLLKFNEGARRVQKADLPPLPGDRGTLAKPVLAVAMKRAQRAQRTAHCRRCGEKGIRTRRDYFKRGPLHKVRGIVVVYFCVYCSRVFLKSWAL
jgi:hypothetical protein